MLESMVTKMSKKQYERANSYVFKCCTGIWLCALAVVIIQPFLRGNGFGSRAVIDLLVSVVCYAIMILGGTKYKSVRLGGVFVFLGISLQYLFIMAYHADIFFFSFAFPILLACMLYLDLRICICGNAFILVSLLICAIRNIADGTADNSVLLHCAVTVVLGIICSISTVILLRNFNSENADTISSQVDQQQSFSQEMASIAGEITQLFATSKSTMDELRHSIESNNAGMKDIAQSTESTVAAVTEQALKCKQIQSQTESTEKQCVDMMKVSNATQKVVAEGVRAIGQLKQKADTVSSASQITVDATKEVLSKITDVRNIAGSIIEIAEQTNLLALNASIEAARAGEAGRGFAVVATEIQSLAEQTNSSSNLITEIISELTSDAEKVMESIDVTVVSVNEQNVVIDTAEKNFKSIDHNVTDMIHKFNDIEKSMGIIASSTAEISDNIENLSATSQEVSSLSEEGMRDSDVAVDRFEEFNHILDSIYEQADKLNKLQA